MRTAIHQQYMSLLIIPIIVSIFLSMLAGNPALAQDTTDEAAAEAGTATQAAAGATGTAPAEEAAPSATTMAAPDIAPEKLSYLLKPLTKDELIVEVEGWIGVLKDKVGEISQMQIQAMDATGTAKEQAQARITELQEERVGLIDRVNLAIDELRGKAGEVADYEAYVKAVSGIDVNVTDISSTWSAVTGWLTSSEGGLRWVRNIILFVVVLVIFRFLAGFAGKVVARAVNRARGTTELLRSFIVNVVHKLVFFIGIVIALSMLEINIGPFLAAMGAAGLILGFALQETLNNFAAGIMILLYRPYDVGDYVDIAGTTGTVDAMSLVSTTLKTPDNQIVVVPNGQIWGNVITNVTGSPQRRIDFTFGIGYDDDVDKAAAVLEEILGAHELILKEPAPTIKVHELADSSVNLIARPWVRTGDYWAVYWDIMREVKKRFDAEGISIPYPQQDVHMHQVSSVGQT